MFEEMASEGKDAMRARHAPARDELASHPGTGQRACEWVRPGDVHTNTIEGVWALMKRSIAGSYPKLSQKHLQAYLDELSWRYNGRDNPNLFRDTLLELLKAEALGYKKLVNHPNELALRPQPVDR